MLRFMGYHAVIGLGIYAALHCPASRADGVLSLNAYLSEVRNKNQAVQGAVESSKASVERRQEKDLATSPTLFANVSVAADSKIPQLPFFTYDQINAHSYSLGISQMTSFGLQGKLYYALDYTSFLNPILPGGGSGAFPFQFYDARPVIELSESIWGNGFGKSVRAGADLIEAQTKAAEFGSKFQARSLLLQAESAYWRLVVARSMVTIEDEALTQAKDIYDYTARRERSNLGEASDALQAKAAWELRKLELKSAKDEERSAARAFNALRNVASNEVTEGLDELTTESVNALTPPARAKLRDDVVAAKHSLEATSASAVLAVEKNKPTLDVFASLALNGRDTTIGGVMGNSYTANRPTRSVGAKLVIPLDLGAAEAARHGAIRDRDAAEMTYQQKLMDQERSWTDLTEKLQEAKERLELSTTIEKAQQDKMKNERKRLNLGRTTTYQVLLFEQDLSQSQLARLKAQADVLGIYTQMKLFSSEEL
jgi:outer membrane protein TolC